MRRRRRAGSMPRFSSRRSAAAGRWSKPRTDVVLLGFGRVGRALSDQIAASRIDQRRAHRRPARSIRVTSSTTRGLSRARLLRLARAKDGGALLSSLGGRAASAAEALAFMADHAVSRPVVVDVTSDDTGALSANRDHARGSMWCSPTRSRSPVRVDELTSKLVTRADSRGPAHPL